MYIGNITVLSRILWGNKYESDDEATWYVNHLNALKSAGILSQIDPSMKEYRAWVILMIYRGAKHEGLIETNVTSD